MAVTYQQASVTARIALIMLYRLRVICDLEVILVRVIQTPFHRAKLLIDERDNLEMLDAKVIQPPLVVPEHLVTLDALVILVDHLPGDVLQLGVEVGAVMGEQLMVRGLCDGADLANQTKVLRSDLVLKELLILLLTLDNVLGTPLAAAVICSR